MEKYKHPKIASAGTFPLKALRRRRLSGGYLIL